MNRTQLRIDQLQELVAKLASGELRVVIDAYVVGQDEEPRPLRQYQSALVERVCADCGTITTSRIVSAADLELVLLSKKNEKGGER